MNIDFYNDWVCSLINNLKDNCDEDTCRKIMQGCAGYHYTHNNMDEIIDGYIGKLDEFIMFLTQNWGWIIHYDKEKGIIIADENKENCVCPVVHKLGDKNVSNVICSCSEGFAEKMFSKVCKRKVATRVIKSILSGDESCMYEIHID